MHRRSALVLLAQALLAACAADPAQRKQAGRAPALGASPRVIAVDDPKPGEIHLVYDLEDAPELWAPMPEDRLSATYRAELGANLRGSLAPRDLLERQRAIYAAIGTERARGDVTNVTLLLEGRAGSIGPATWLEALLFREQARRYPMIAHPTEFSAFVLQKPGRIRVYFSSLDLVGAKLRRAVTDQILADVGSGLELTAHVHNHTFMFNRVPGDRMWTTKETIADVGGGLAPSTTDVNLYRGFQKDAGLRGAWVTNGLDTARFRAEDFDRLVAAP